MTSNRHTNDGEKRKACLIFWNSSKLASQTVPMTVFFIHVCMYEPERHDESDGGVRGAGAVRSEEPNMAHTGDLCPHRRRPL